MKLDDTQVVELKRFIRRTAIGIGIVADSPMPSSMLKLKQEVIRHVRSTFECFMSDVTVEGTNIIVRLDNRMDSHKYLVDVSDCNRIFNFDEFIEERLKSFNI